MTMVKSKSTFADAALHGPHAKLPPEARAARKVWLEGNATREHQLAAVAEEGMCGYAESGGRSYWQINPEG